MTLQGDEIIWLPKLIGFSLYSSQYVSCWIGVNTFGNFLRLAHFLFQHSFLFYLIDGKAMKTFTDPSFHFAGNKNVKTQNGAACIAYMQAQWLLIDRRSKKQSKHILEIFPQLQLPDLGHMCLYIIWTVC